MIKIISKEKMGNIHTSVRNQNMMCKYFLKVSDANQGTYCKFRNLKETGIIITFKLKRY